MKFPYLLSALLLAGCAQSDPPMTASGPGALSSKHNAPDTASVRTPEQLKAYPVGRYEDPDDPDLMHEGHTVYRAETSPEWDTDPNAPTSLPLGPGELATADPTQEHTTLTAELEQRLKQEDQLLQTTYEQNERLAQEIKTLQDQEPHVRLAIPDSEPVQQPPMATPEPQPKAGSSPAPQTINPSQPNPKRTWPQWFQSVWSKPTPPPSTQED
jgi:hypothetical protein